MDYEVGNMLLLQLVQAGGGDGGLQGETDYVAVAVGTGKGGGVDYKVRQIMLLLQLVQAKQGSVNYEVRQTVSLLLQLAQVGCGGGERRT